MVDPGEPPLTLSIGAVIYGMPSKNWDPMIESVMQQIMELREEHKTGLNLNVVFHEPRRLGPIDWEGVRTSSFRKKDNLLMVQVALPEEPEPEWTNTYLVSRIYEAIDAAEEWARRRKMDPELESTRAIVAQIV